MRYYIFDFCAATLKALPSWSEQSHSFKIAKLNLIIQNNSLIYGLLFSSILDFCAATLKDISLLERTLIFIIHEKL